MAEGSDRQRRRERKNPSGKISLLTKQRELSDARLLPPLKNICPAQLSAEFLIGPLGFIQRS